MPGSRVIRHRGRVVPDPFVPAVHDRPLLEAMEAHLDRWFGRDRMVFHELLSDLVHIDIQWVPPGRRFDFHRLVTTGVASAPMSVPDGFEGPPFIELTIALPPQWSPRRDPWPLSVLEVLGRLPHEYGTFLWYGHAVPNRDPPTPYADTTELCGALLLEPVDVPDGFDVLEVGDGRRVRILSILPLYRDELDYLRREEHPRLLWKRIDEREIGDVLDPRRRTLLR